MEPEVCKAVAIDDLANLKWEFEKTTFAICCICSSVAVGCVGHDCFWGLWMDCCENVVGK